MELIRRLAVATAVNVAALAVTAWVFDGVGVDGWGALILAGVVFGIVNTVVKPIVTVLALPVILLSLGVALFFVNMLMLALTDWVVNGLVIDGFWTLVGATLVVWLVNVLVESVFGVRGHARKKQGRRSPFGRRSS
jgi:putative membrane protein